MRPRHPAMRRSSTAASGSSMPAKSIILDALRRPLLHKTEHVTGDAAHLDFLGTLGNAVAAVVPRDMCERLVARIAHSAVHLHGPVRRLAAQAIGPVVAHRDFV